MTDTITDPEKQLGALISSHVATLRQQKKLSLDSLAKRAELSKGTVVAIENGRANPSIGVLCRLAAALSVSVADLVNPPQISQPVPLIEPTTPSRLWSSEAGGAAVLQASTSGATMFELWSWELEPGEVYETDGHSNGTMELIAVQSGKLEIRVGPETRALSAGDAARLRTDHPHSYRAVSPEKTTFTMAVLEKG